MFRWWVQGSCSAGGSYFVWVFFFSLFPEFVLLELLDRWSLLV
jgi:hypothetical protein